MRVKNYTTISDDTVAEVLAFVKPTGVTGDLSIKNCQHTYRGRAYPEGCPEHGNRRPYAVVSVGAAKCFPFRGADRRRVRAQQRAHRRQAPVPMYTHHYSGGTMTHVTTRMVRPGAPTSRGYLPAPAIGSRVEALVYIMAHELRHLWQARVPRGRRVWGARGQFSERDADAYALRMLRAWRRR